MIATGEVQYLHERLSVYRIHGANEFAQLVGDAYLPKRDPRLRAPRSLYFLEQWIDECGLDGKARDDAVSYVRRVEYMNRMPSRSRRLAEPAATIALFGAAGFALPPRTVDAALNQSHAPVTLVCPRAYGAVAVPAGAPVTAVGFDDEPTLPEFERLRRAYQAAGGDYVAFVRAGDCLDREYLERHVRVQQHGVLAGVTCCDVRLTGRDAALLHADVFANSGAWKQPLQHIPPLSVGLGAWVGAPLGACLFRRGDLLDRFFAGATPLPEALADCASWLLFQLAQHTGGVLRLRETLASIALPDGAAASYGYLAAPAGLDGALRAPPPREAALWLQEFYLDNEDAFRRVLPEKWHRDFEPWLDAQTA
ncbi:MAG: hypothetical protein JNM90_05470 [Burkholderiales bacterium]|nr:hypothetical protein [Burkholderiales bacterium]